MASKRDRPTAELQPQVRSRAASSRRPFVARPDLVVTRHIPRHRPRLSTNKAALWPVRLQLAGGVRHLNDEQRADADQERNARNSEILTLKGESYRLHGKDLDIRIDHKPTDIT